MGTKGKPNMPACPALWLTFMRLLQLITMEKIAVDEQGEIDTRQEPVGLPAHFDFRTSYFNVKAEARAALANGKAP